MSQAQIEKEKETEVLYLRFQKLEESKYSLDELLTYLRNSYPGIILKENKPSESYVEYEYTGFLDAEKVISIQYIKLGVPGYFINIYPITKRTE